MAANHNRSPDQTGLWPGVRRRLSHRRTPSELVLSAKKGGAQIGDQTYDMSHLRSFSFVFVVPERKDRPGRPLPSQNEEALRSKGFFNREPLEHLHTWVETGSGPAGKRFIPFMRLNETMSLASMEVNTVCEHMQ